MITLLILLGIYTLSVKVIAPKARKLLQQFSEKHTNFVNSLLKRKQITPEELQRLKNGFTFLICLIFSTILWLVIKIQENNKTENTIQLIKETLENKKTLKNDTIIIEPINTNTKKQKEQAKQLSKPQLNAILKAQKTR